LQIVQLQEKKQSFIVFIIKSAFFIIYLKILKKPKFENSKIQ